MPRMFACFLATAFVTSLLALIPNIAAAQAEIAAAVVADPERESTKTFSVGADAPHRLTFTLPDFGAAPVSVRLRITRAESDETNAGNFTLVATLPAADGKPFGSRQLGKQIPGRGEAVEFTAQQSVLENLRTGQVTIEIARQKSTGRGERRTWDGAGAPLPQGRPKLILSYAVPAGARPPATVGQPGAFGSRGLLPDVALVEHEWATPRRMASGMHSHFPAFTKGVAFVVVDGDAETASKRRLLALAPPYGRTLWSKTVPGAGQHIVAGERDELMIVGEQTLYVLQLKKDPSKEPEDPVRIELAGDSGGPDLKPIQPPVLGPDGSLYMATNQAILALDPNLRRLWSIPLKGEKPGRLTLGPAGRFLYTLTDKSLLTIDAQRGEINRLEHDLSAGGTALTARFAPAAVREADTGKILPQSVMVAADNVETGQMARLRNVVVEAKGATEDQKAKTEEEPTTGWTLSEGWRDQGDRLWAQPIPGHPGLNTAKKQIYALGLSDEACAVPNAEGETENAHGSESVGVFRVGGVSDVPPEDPVQIGDTFCVARDGFWERARLVTDAKGRLYTLGRNDSATELHSFMPDLPKDRSDEESASTLRTGSIGPARVPDLSGQAHLMFGDDGTLYAVDPAHNDFYALMLQVKMPGTDGWQVDSPTHLRVTGLGGLNTTIAASGTVALAPGAHLRPGTTIRISAPRAGGAR